MRPAETLAPVGSGAWAAVRAAALRLERVRPVFVLAPLAAVQWAVVLALALTHRHNGWLFYNGGDATEYWAEQWAVAHGWVPHAVLGYGLSVLYAWVPWLFGTTLVEGLPAIMLLQALVLVPLALVLVHAVARRIAGPLFALLAAVLWVATPLAAIRLFRASYRPDYLTYFLVPHGYGLTDMADFASLVVALAVTLFVFRALDRGSRNDALIAGLLLGLALGIKPANALLVPAFGVAFLAARRWSHLVVAGLGVVPAVTTLALWKQKGLGTLPLLSGAPQLREASGVSIPGLNTSSYITFAWSKLHENLLEFHEVFWDVRLLEYIALAGAFALIRKAPAKGLYVTLWFAAFMVFKGGTPDASVYSTSFYRLGEPGFPAFLLMLAALVLLVPGWGRRVVAERAPDRPLRWTRGTGAGVLLAGVLPLVVVAALSPAPAGAIVRDSRTSTEAPISAALDVRTERTPGGVRLTWKRAHAGSSSTFFVIYRFRVGDGCSYDDRGAKTCLIDQKPLATTRATSFVDQAAPAGTTSYRVAMAANYASDPAQGGDMVLLSPVALAPPG